MLQQQRLLWRYLSLVAIIQTVTQKKPIRRRLKRGGAKWSPSQFLIQYISNVLQYACIRDRFLVVCVSDAPYHRRIRCKSVSFYIITGFSITQINKHTVKLSNQLQHMSHKINVYKSTKVQNKISPYHSCLRKLRHQQ
jgi:hypothetical protein